MWKKACENAHVDRPNPPGGNDMWIFRKGSTALISSISALGEHNFAAFIFALTYECEAYASSSKHVASERFVENGIFGNV